MTLKLTITLLALFSLIGGIAYIKHRAIVEHEQSIILKQAKENKALQEKYDSLSTQYETLKRTRAVVAQKNKQQEERLIDEHKDYYSVDVFDLTSLHHIQSVQSGAITPPITP